MKREPPPGMSQEAFDKYVKPSLDRERQRKIDKRKKWWSENWIGFAGLVIAILALIVAAWSLRLSYIALSIK